MQFIIMKIGYEINEAMNEFEIQSIQTMLNQILSNKTLELDFVELKDASIDSSYDLIICFSDNAVFDISQNYQDIPPLLCVELPGDDSFFAQCTISDLDECLSFYYFNREDIDVRSLLHMVVNGSEYTALNDIHISSSEVNSRMRFDILIKEKSLFDNAETANSILISTPTGSTAMAMNLGGPLIHNEAEVFQIQTIAPRNIYSSHFIISDSSKIQIELIEAKQPISIQFDNRRVSIKDTQFEINKSKNVAKFIRYEKNHNSSLSEKLINKISFEDTSSLTSSAKFVLHILQNDNRELTATEMSEITGIENQKTLRNALNLLMKKGFIKRKANISDLREFLYSFNDLR